MTDSSRIEELRRRVLLDPASPAIASVESTADGVSPASDTVAETAGRRADRALFELQSWLAAILAARARRHAGKSLA